MTQANLTALLLTNRLVEVGVKPLSAGEFWGLLRRVENLDDLDRWAGGHSVGALSDEETERVAKLLAASTAFAFERERLEEEGVRLVSALDSTFPPHLRAALGDSCPAFMLVAGPTEFLTLPAVGVVGSRNVSEAGMSVAAHVATEATRRGRVVISGLARGVDQAAMAAALAGDGRVVGVPSEGIRVVARNAEVRRHVHEGRLCLASPYAPAVRFTAGNAMGRNKVVYGLAEVTLVVASDSGSGGTWEGAREALRRGFGRVAVWTGEGAGRGNADLVRFGAVAVDDVAALFDLGEPTPVGPNPQQASLFE